MKEFFIPISRQATESCFKHSKAGLRRFYSEVISGILIFFRGVNEDDFFQKAASEKSIGHHRYSEAADGNIKELARAFTVVRIHFELKHLNKTEKKNQGANTESTDLFFDL